MKDWKFVIPELASPKNAFVFGDEASAGIQQKAASAARLFLKRTGFPMKHRYQIL